MMDRQWMGRMLSYAHKEKLWRRGSRILAAVSGGPDSLGLLLFLDSIREEEGIEVGCCCVDHHLRKESGEEADYVGKICLERKIPFYRRDVDVKGAQKGGETTTKIILETGELAKASRIAEATRLCLNKGVGFIKTSTGKTPVSATPEAANIILETIAASRRKAGFKASGGIRTIDEAKKYLTLAQTVMGSGWISPEHLRIGASSLLDNLLQTIKQGY